MSKKKKLVTIGYTSEPLIMQRRDIFGKGVMESSVCPELNEINLRVCPNSRHNKCVREKGCQELIPQGSLAENRMLWPCKRYTDKGEAKYNKILKRGLDKCRAVQITIEEAK